MCIDSTISLTRCFPGDAMSNIAGTYGELGRHQDALALQEKTLEFYRRVLPENHPSIGVMQFVFDDTGG